MNTESLEFFRAIGTALAVFVPLIVFWLQKKDKLHKTKHFIELMKAHEELSHLRSRPQSDELNEKIDRLLKEVDEEIHYSFDRFGLRFFFGMVFIEMIFVATLLSQWSDYINKIFSGPSYESGLYFLEGIFQSTTARLILFMLLVSISVFFTIQSTMKWVSSMNHASKRNLLLLGVFHLFLIVIIVVVSIILSLLDPIIPYW